MSRSSGGGASGRLTTLCPNPRGQRCSNLSFFHFRRCQYLYCFFITLRLYNLLLLFSYSISLLNIENILKHTEGAEIKPNRGRIWLSLKKIWSPRYNATDVFWTLRYSATTPREARRLRPRDTLAPPRHSGEQCIVNLSYWGKAD